MSSGGWLPAVILPVAGRLHELEAEDPGGALPRRHDGLGAALWTLLGLARRSRRGWKLYDKRGAERHDLPDALLAAEAEDRLTFAAGLHEAGAMKEALAGAPREVREDGVVGGELRCPRARRPGPTPVTGAGLRVTVQCPATARRTFTAP